MQLKLGGAYIDVAMATFLVSFLFESNVIILHKLRSKYMRKHQVESHLLCYEPLFNTSRIKEKHNCTPLGKKMSHMT